MEIKNEQNISDILDSFVNTIKKDKDVKSALVLIETKDARILQVKGVEQAYPNRYTNFVKWFHQSNIH